MINIHTDAKNIKHYDLDTINDVSLLDKNKLAPGSTIFIMANSKYYMLNIKKQWTEINLTPSKMNKNNIAYDGGSIDDSDPN